MCAVCVLGLVHSNNSEFEDIWTTAELGYCGMFLFYFIFLSLNQIIGLCGNQSSVWKTTPFTCLTDESFSEEEMHFDHKLHRNDRPTDFVSKDLSCVLMVIRDIGWLFVLMGWIVLPPKTCTF